MSAFPRHPHRLGPAGAPDALRSRLPLEELRRRLGRVELGAVDLDQCVFPGFSQSVLGYFIFGQIALAPRRAADLGLLPRLLRGGLFIRRVELKQLLGRQPTNLALMLRYERSMRGIPEHYFCRGARWIPPRSFGGALEALALLGQRVPLGLISFGIQPIADQYRAQLNARAGAEVVVFAEANAIRFAPGKDGRPRFAGYRGPIHFDPAHKLALLRRHLAARGAEVPLVIGNGRDEVPMAQYARAHGGLSIGVAPPPALRPAFDLLLTADSWQPLLALLRTLL